MDNLTDLLEKLRISLSSEEISNRDGRQPPDVLVRSLVDTLKENEAIYPGSEFQTILPLLKSHLEGDDLNLTTVLLELSAEICKFEHTRILCVNAGLVSCIVNSVETENPAVTLQALRAIGNITCDNSIPAASLTTDKAREEMLENRGVEKIINKMKEFQNEGANRKYETKYHFTVCGAIHNVSYDNEVLQKAIVQHGAIPLLLRYVEDDDYNSSVPLMATNAISSLIEIDEGVSSFIAKGGCEVFVKALKKSSGVHTTLLVECLRTLSQEDGIKRALVSENCVVTLQEIISSNISYDGEDVLEKLKISVDLIILILGDDYCLGELFAEENNVFVDKILLWMQCPHAYVRNSCAVAIGNIARTETNCIRLVKMQVHQKLIALLENGSSGTEEDRVQLHISVLSALKNMAIPASNKCVLIEAGTLDYTVECLTSPDTPSPLAFRAIAVMRLLVQGQDGAVDTVCSQEECLINLVSLAQNTAIEGLKSEASRLLATLLKNARKSGW